MRNSGYIPFPDAVWHFTMLLSKLPPDVLYNIRNKEFHFEVLTTTEGVNYTSFMKNDVANDMTYIHRKVLGFVSNFRNVFPKIGVYYCSMDDNPDFALVFYVLFDSNLKSFALLLSFCNRFDSIASAFEEDYAKNFANRLSPTLFSMYESGLQLMNFQSFYGNAFIISPGLSFAICPLHDGLDNASISYWQNISPKGLDNIVQRYLASVIETVFLEAPLLQTTMMRFAFINSGNTDFFGANVMKNFIVDPNELSYDKRNQLLRTGYLERTLDYNNSELSSSDITGYDEIQERIQVIESFDPRDSQVIAFASYDICWPDASHSWACKIPISITELLNRYDFSELDTKIPNISKAYSNGMINNFEDGAIVESNNGELIFFLDYNDHNKGKENAIHLKGSKWLRQTMIELVKFNHHLKIKEARENSKSSGKYGDTITRGIIYQLIGTLMGG